MSRRRFETDEATTVRPPGGGDGGLPAGLLAPLDDHPGPARRLPHSKSAAMIASIVDAATREVPAAPDAARPAASSGSPDSPRAVRPAPRRLVPLLAAALIAAAVVGAAAAVITTRYFTPAPAPQVSPPVPAAPPAPTPTPAAPAPVPATPDEIELEPAAPPSAAAEPTAPRAKKPAVRDKAPADPPRDRVLPADAPPEDVLALANQRRKERAWRAADELYRRVIRSHPKSDAAVVAEVASATLHLEHLGDPAGALAGYRRALRARPSGALGEEARWGIAEAHRARGDRTSEAAALRTFLDAHPGSAMAPAAKKRLAELTR